MAEVRIRVSDHRSSIHSNNSNVTRNGNNVSTVMIGGDAGAGENGHDTDEVAAVGVSGVTAPHH